MNSAMHPIARVAEQMATWHMAASRVGYGSIKHHMAHTLGLAAGAAPPVWKAALTYMPAAVVRCCQLAIQVHHVHNVWNTLLLLHCSSILAGSSSALLLGALGALLLLLLSIGCSSLTFNSWPSCCLLLCQEAPPLLSDHLLNDLLLNLGCMHRESIKPSAAAGNHRLVARLSSELDDGAEGADSRCLKTKHTLHAYLQFLQSNAHVMMNLLQGLMLDVQSPKDVLDCKGEILNQISSNLGQEGLRLAFASYLRAHRSERGLSAISAFPLFLAFANSLLHCACLHLQSAECSAATSYSNEQVLTCKIIGKLSGKLCV
jgi:hypothetical protein